MAKTAALELLDSLNLISRKIWMIEKSTTVHWFDVIFAITKKYDVKWTLLYFHEIFSKIAWERFSEISTLCLLHFFFVKATGLVMKLLNELISQNIFWWERISRFSTLCCIITYQQYPSNHLVAKGLLESSKPLHCATQNKTVFGIKHFFSNEQWRSQHPTFHVFGLFYLDFRKLSLIISLYVKLIVFLIFTYSEMAFRNTTANLVKLLAVLTAWLHRQLPNHAFTFSKVRPVEK